MSGHHEKESCRSTTRRLRSRCAACMGRCPMQCHYNSAHTCPCALAQSLRSPLLLLIVCACAVVGNFIVDAVNYIYLVIAISSSSSNIGMQSSAVHGRAVARNSSYCEAPTLRSNATTSRLFSLMAHLRGVLPRLQAGG